jgi:lysophospholipase L1-like esterase
MGIRRIVLLVGWNLGLLLAGLVAAELTFGGWLRAPGLWDLAVFRDVDWRLETAEKYPGPGTARYVRDHYGLRGAYGTPADIDILTLGGSTTDQRFVGEGETWQDVLGRCLKQSGAPARIANAGVSGQSTRGHLLNLKSWLPHIPGLKPRLVIVYVGINDIQLEGREDNEDPTRYNESDRPLDRLRLLRKWIEGNSALVRLIRTAKGNWKAYQAGYHPLTVPPASAGTTAADQVDRAWRAESGRTLALGSAEHARAIAAVTAERGPLLADYRRRLESLVAAIRQWEARPLVVTQAAGSYRRVGDTIVGNIDQYAILASYNAVAQDVCRQTDAECLPFGETVRWEDGDLYDTIHTTPQGSARVGEAVCRYLAGRPN